MQTAFQIDLRDNVATALEALGAGPVRLLGDAAVGEMIVKYGVVIGRATADIPAGSWVHLHVMCSNYDDRSSHLDVVTGAPKDIRYE